MIIVTSIFNLPFLILIWLIEAYLFLVVMRLILTYAPWNRKIQFRQQTILLTDFLPDLTRKYLTRLGYIAPPNWVPWTITILPLCLTRQILIWIVTR
jgi:hypothetical protein